MIPVLTPLEVWEFAGKAKLFLIDATPDAAGRSLLEGVLTGQERARAAQFRFEADRARFGIARGALRRILGAYCEVPAERIEFRSGPHGKPALQYPDPRLQFNVSHSGDYALIAVTGDVPCGVDLERRRDGVAGVAIAGRMFSSAERAWLAGNPEGFLRIWTAKEAVVKALGGGLSIPLDGFDVSPQLEGSAEPVEMHSLGRIWVRELNAAAGYAAALATVGEPPLLR